MTKPVAPVVKEKVVYLYWTTSETIYRELEYMMEQFGVLTGPIEYQVYRARPGATEEEKLMDGVMSMDRQVKMKVRKNIPSIILVQGKRVNVRYDGQARSCSRCLRRLHMCPTRGDPRACQELWEKENKKKRSDEDTDDEEEERSTPKRSVPRGDLEELMKEVCGSEPAWAGNTTDEGVYADYVELTNLPPEMTKVNLLAFIRQKDIAIAAGQLMRDPKNPSKWQVKNLLPQEVECFMLLVNGNKIGKDGRKIECFPAMTSTPNKSKATFAPSRDTSGAEVGAAAAEESAPTIKKNLEADLEDLGEVMEVSPDTNVSFGTNVKSSVMKSDNQFVKVQSGASGDDEDEESDDDDDDIKEVDEDDRTLPKPGSGSGVKVATPKVVLNLKKTGDGYLVSDEEGEAKGERLKTETRKRKDSTGSQGGKISTGNTTLGVKPPKTPTPAAVAKARITLKALMEAAEVEKLRTQEEASELTKKAEDTKDEKDLKLAEKAEKAASTAKRKYLTLVNKWEENTKTNEALKNLHAKGKRSADDQSPGKEDAVEEALKVTTSGGKKGRNLKKKTKEEADLEKSLFNEQ